LVLLDAELSFVSNGPSFKGIGLEKYAAMDQNTGYGLVLLVSLGEICNSTYYVFLVVFLDMEIHFTSNGMSFEGFALEKYQDLGENTVILTLFPSMCRRNLFFDLSWLPS